MVMEHDPISIISAKVTLGLLRSWDAAPGLVGAVLVNRGALSIPMKPAELKLQLGCNVLGLIPSAGETCINAQECGESIVRSKPKSLVADALVDIADQVAERLGTEKLAAVAV